MAVRCTTIILTAAVFIQVLVVCSCDIFFAFLEKDYNFYRSSEGTPVNIPVTCGVLPDSDQHADIRFSSLSVNISISSSEENNGNVLLLNDNDRLDCLPVYTDNGAAASHSNVQLLIMDQPKSSTSTGNGAEYLVTVTLKDAIGEPSIPSETTILFDSTSIHIYESTYELAECVCVCETNSLLTWLISFQGLM